MLITVANDKTLPEVETFVRKVNMQLLTKNELDLINTVCVSKYSA